MKLKILIKYVTINQWHLQCHIEFNFRYFLIPLVDLLNKRKIQIKHMIKIMEILMGKK
jgi:3-hydroxymyristoyl/3-hydroxydecanoyl-(acyl carrier protein) dehydratase